MHRLFKGLFYENRKSVPHIHDCILRRIYYIYFTFAALPDTFHFQPHGRHNVSCFSRTFDNRWNAREVCAERCYTFPVVVSVIYFLCIGELREAISKAELLLFLIPAALALMSIILPIFLPPLLLITPILYFCLVYRHVAELKAKSHTNAWCCLRTERTGDGSLCSNLIAQRTVPCLLPCLLERCLNKWKKTIKPLKYNF